MTNHQDLKELERIKERIERHHVKDPETGCWVWTQFLTYGYGYLSTGEGRRERAHRASYRAHVGPIAEGQVIDHLCRNRACVNPAHLEAVSPQENNRRSNSTSASNARKTHCDRGHALSGDNLMTDIRGNRSCRECRKIRNSLRYLPEGTTWDQAAARQAILNRADIDRLPTLLDEREALVGALTDAEATLVAAKQEMWISARATWNLADFKNWAVVQQIDRSLTMARQALSSIKEKSCG